MPRTETQTNEFRVFGPPGTGKTTYLARQIERARKVHGGENIFVTSFTRAAAIEIASRVGIILPKASVGTLHAHCYRALDFPELAENHISEFNAKHPDLAITADVDVDDPFDVQPATAPGAEAYQEMHRLRSMLIPLELWPTNVRILYDAWEDWKRGDNLLDFTDLLEIALKDISYAPNNPVVGFVDEAQDMTPLQFALVRKWGSKMDTLVLVGDEDQCLYNFLGASPDSMLDPPLPDDHIIVLGRSYRVPQSILSWSENIISKVERRQKKEYKPREENGKVVEGKVRLSQANAKDPSMLLLEIEKDMKQGKKIMVLASCAYMLIPFIQLMRQEGIAYHNPYRLKQGAWNPLNRGRGTSSAERLTSFLKFSKSLWGDNASSTWSADDMQKWIPLIDSKVLKRGIKEKLKKAKPTDKFTIADVFSDEDALTMVFGSEEKKLEWFEANLTNEGKKKMQYPLKVLKKKASQLLDQPQIIVGTIHSVKGGEADIVYVLPDFARPQVKAWYGDSSGRDSLRRLYYVAGTRAREELVLCTPSYGVHGFPLMEGLA
jgi:superfamily I DNA/RNA helicase